jgi:hypothetical protein
VVGLPTSVRVPQHEDVNEGEAAHTGAHQPTAAGPRQRVCQRVRVLQASPGDPQDAAATLLDVTRLEILPDVVF